MKPPARHGTVARKITIHIGTEKTGTTTLQAQLFHNRELLKSHGLLYPVTPGHKVNTGLKQLAFDEHGRGRGAGSDDDPELASVTARLMAGWREEISQSGCEHVLFSHEHLSSRVKKPRRIGRLVTAMQGLADQVQVLIFIRPQYELFQSAYSTWIRGGGTQLAVPPGKGKSRYFDYDVMLTPWERAAGASNIIVKRFGRQYFKDGDLTASFFDALGMPVPPGFTKFPPKHVSFDAPTAEYLRLVNAQLAELPEGSQDEFRRDLINALTKLSQPGGLILPASLLQSIDESFEASNQVILERYFPGQSDRLFAPFDASRYRPFSELSPAKAVELSLALLRDSWRPAVPADAPDAEAGRVRRPEEARGRRAHGGGRQRRLKATA